jgi:hypothetical protein
VSETELRYVKIAGQPIVIHSHFLYLHLKKGPFLSAGKKFGWNPPVPGLGVNAEIVRYAREKDLVIRIFVKAKLDRCYETHPNIFLGLGRRYIVERTALYLLPWSGMYFKTVTDFPQEIRQYFEKS